MNKKEIAEIRRRFNPEKNGVTCIRGCYVNEKREIISAFGSSLTMMPEDEAEKYLAIFKRTLSGAQGRNLVDINFSTLQVSGSEEHGLLMSLRDTALKDDEAVDKFFARVIESLSFEGNYLILLMHDAYDIPRRAKDGQKLEDSSEQFRYILCSICPVKMSKSALSYCPSENGFHSRSVDWVVSPPELGFMFPAFDDRASNIYNALYYTGNVSDSHSELTDALFKAELPMPADEQKEAFHELLAETLEEECSYEVMQTVHEQLSALITEHEADKTVVEPLAITKCEVKAVLASCEVSEEHMAAFEEKYDEKFGVDADLAPQNLVDVKQFELRTPDVVVRVNPEHSELVETRMIDGVKYVLIRADGGVEVNGVNVNIAPDKPKT